MNLKNLFLAASCAALAGVAFAAPRSDSSLEGVSEMPFILTGNGAGSDTAGAGTATWWNNGGADGLNALQSQSVGSFNARAADDFILESGHWHLTQSITVCMAISVNVTAPVVKLEIYSDCNGEPGTLLTTLTEPTRTPLTGPAPFPGFALSEFTFDWSTFQFGELDGCERYWISPVGCTTGGYFWPTSGGGIVQGGQGKFRAPSLGYSDWTNGDDVVNFRRCTDFCFRINAKSCYTLKDQGEYDLAGQASIKFPSVEGFDAAAADNFQVSSSRGPVAVCRIEAYLATNCDPTRVFGNIYTNQCDLPGPVLYTLENPEVIPQTGVFYDGLQVYCFRFDCPAGVTLNGGNNYWFSLSALSGGTIFDRAVFLYKQRAGTCEDIHITGGVYKNSLIGVDAFTPVVDDTLAGVEREFAFRVYGSPLPAPGGAQDPQDLLAGDVNGDGRVDLQDLAVLISNWNRTLN